ncbi:MAG TPA: hypothetical protein VN612_10475 [Acidobacteriaceae bacterium]|nr:hypothetical protein [Acidobacteriaceae bacterium]
MNTYQLADRLAELVYEPRIERLEYVTRFAAQINPSAYTKQEMEWIAEGIAAAQGEQR